MDIWDVLGIAPTTDKQKIQSAFASALPLHHPDKDPQGFARLKAAFDAAMQSIQDATSVAQEAEKEAEKETGTDAGGLSANEQADGILEAFHSLINEFSWLLANCPGTDVGIDEENLSEEIRTQISIPILKGFLGATWVPTEVFKRYNTLLRWLDNELELNEQIPADAIKRLKSIVGSPNLEPDTVHVQDLNNEQGPEYMQNRRMAFAALRNGYLPHAAEHFDRAKAIHPVDHELFLIEASLQYFYGHMDMADHYFKELIGFEQAIPPLWLFRTYAARLAEATDTEGLNVLIQRIDTAVQSLVEQGELREQGNVGTDDIIALRSLSCSLKSMLSDQAEKIHQAIHFAEEVKHLESNNLVAAVKSAALAGKVISKAKSLKARPFPSLTESDKQDAIEVLSILHNNDHNDEVVALVEAWLAEAELTEIPPYAALLYANGLAHVGQAEKSKQVHRVYLDDPDPIEGQKRSHALHFASLFADTESELIIQYLGDLPEEECELIDGHYYLANSYKNLSELDQSLYHINRSIGSQGDNVRSLNLRSSLFKALNRQHDYIADLQRLLEIERFNHHLWDKLIKAFIDIEEYEKALECCPQTPNQHWYTGRVFHCQGEYQKALSAFDRYLETYNMCVSTAINYRDIYQALGDESKVTEYESIISQLNETA